MKTILNKIFQKFDRWSIGIHTGISPYEMGEPEGIKNPILTARHVTDRKAEFVADPFMVKDKGIWYLFFEVLDSIREKGDIALAISRDGLHWQYRQIVLSEPFHLSYPYVFRWGNEYYMVPESVDAGNVRLYKAVDFPLKWQFETCLISGAFCDSSLVHYNDHWWMFATAEKRGLSSTDTLRLFHADDLIGPWKEHPKSPIVEGDCHKSRSAGKILISEGRIIRFAQDGFPNYGSKIHAFEISELSLTDYQENPYFGNPILKASGKGWNKDGMHTIDPHLEDGGQWLACVDGNLQYPWIEYILYKYILHPRRLMERLLGSKVKIDSQSV